MPDDLKESRQHAKPWAVATVQIEALVKTQLAVDQIRLREHDARIAHGVLLRMLFPLRRVRGAELSKARSS